MARRNKAAWAADISRAIREAATSYEPSKKMAPGELQGYLANLRRNTQHDTRQKPREKSPRDWGD